MSEEKSIFPLERKNYVTVDLDKTFSEQLRFLINVNNIDTITNIPDHILADYLVNIMKDVSYLTNAVRNWHGDLK